MEHMGKNQKEKKRKQIDTCLAVTERGSDSCAVAHHEALYHVIVVLYFRSSMKGE